MKLTSMSRPFRLIIWVVAIVVVSAVALSVGRGGYVGELISRAGETGSPVPIRDLNDINVLRRAFNADARTPRLILLVSPT